MKLSLCLAALATADERKFTNKDEFMDAETPAWWTDKPAVDRMATLECKRADYFSTYFGSVRPQIQQLWADAISDIEIAVNRRGCLNDPSRRRRDAEDERGFNPCTDWKKNDVWKDTDFFMKFVGTFVREVIYRDDQAHCQRLGYRILRRLDRLNAYTEYAYCDKIDNQMKACSWRYYSGSGKVMPHPRKNNDFQQQFGRP